MCWGNCSLGRPRKLCLHPPPAARKAKITKEYTLPEPPLSCNITILLYYILLYYPPAAARKAKIKNIFYLSRRCLAILQCCNFTEFLPRNISSYTFMSCVILCYNVTMLLCYNVAILLNSSRKIYVTCSSCLALYYVTMLQCYYVAMLQLY